MNLLLGDRLREARKNKGLKQTEVCKELGIINARLSSYERGTRKPDHMVLTQLAELYGVTVDYLITGKVSNDPSLNVRELLRSKNLHWDGIPLTEVEMAPIRNLLEMVMRERITPLINKDEDSTSLKVEQPCY